MGCETAETSEGKLRKVQASSKIEVSKNRAAGSAQRRFVAFKEHPFLRFV
jgi:hypothetical protein